MLFASLLSPSRADTDRSATETMRTHVCPPTLARSAHRRSWVASTWLNHWLGSSWMSHPFEPSMSISTARPMSRRSAAQLTEVRQAFIDTLNDISAPDTHDLLQRIRVARSMRELWHLRPQLFDQVAMRFSQQEAQHRLLPLNRHFPTRAPRSGFMDWTAD
ncbi:MAG: hypothetical protein JWP52_464 [Rhizobacter sp.]|nr:hypothetical protein [Rhizobacter sp.]